MKQSNPLYEKYPYLVMWCQMMGSMPYYLDQQIEQAERVRADKDVIYFNGNEPIYFRSCESPSTIHYFSVRGLEKLKAAQ